MHFVIHETTFPLYSVIVVSSVVIGVFTAIFLMKRAGAGKQTLRLTAIFTFMMIFMCSFMLSYIVLGRVGFMGAGGALGLVAGALISVLIHRDHVKESFAAWVIAAPLMYGLAKIACHIAGCCHGMEYKGPLYIIYPDKENVPYFPVQLAEVVLFLLIFTVGIVILKKKSYLTAAGVVLGMSAAAKIGLDFLRFSHVGKIVTKNQIMVAIITAASYIMIAIISNMKEKEESGQ